MTQDEFNDKVLQCIELMQERTESLERSRYYMVCAISGIVAGIVLGCFLSAVLL